jgi:hypothetical protein
MGTFPRRQNRARNRECQGAANPAPTGRLLGPGPPFASMKSPQREGACASRIGQANWERSQLRNLPIFGMPRKTGGLVHKRMLDVTNQPPT